MALPVLTPAGGRNWSLPGRPIPRPVRCLSLCERHRLRRNRHVIDAHDRRRGQPRTGPGDRRRPRRHRTPGGGGQPHRARRRPWLMSASSWPMPPTPPRRARSWTATTRRSWSWLPGRARCRARCTTTRGRRSRSTGTPTSRSRSTGCARRCLRPLPPGSRVVVISSGAALAGSPLSGGLCGGESHTAVHHRLRPGRGRSRRSGHHLHRRAAAAHPVDRPRPSGRGRVRGPQAARPRTTTSAGSARRSPRRSRARPSSSWWRPTPRTSPAHTCSPAAGCSNSADVGAMGSVAVNWKTVAPLSELPQDPGIGARPRGLHGEVCVAQAGMRGGRGGGNAWARRARQRRCAARPWP